MDSRFGSREQLHFLRTGKAAKGEHFADDTANWLTLDMDDEIDGSNLGFGIGEGRSIQNLLRVRQSNRSLFRLSNESSGVCYSLED